jgi:hypothetical protein
MPDCQIFNKISIKVLSLYFDTFSIFNRNAMRSVTILKKTGLTAIGKMPGVNP